MHRWSSQPAHEDWSAWFSPLSRAADFGVGTASPCSPLRASGSVARTRGILAVLGIAALGLLVATREFTLMGEWWHPAYAVAVSVALAGVVLHDGPWPRALEWKPLVTLGGIGYGIYLIHEPVMRFLGHLGLLPEARPGPFFLVSAVLVAVPTIALAWLSSAPSRRPGSRRWP